MKTSCKRHLSSYTVSLAIGSCFFLLMLYMTSQEIDFQAYGGNEVELNVSRWIIPVHDLTVHKMAGEIPDGWKLLVPSDTNLSCSQCIKDDMKWSKNAYTRDTKAKGSLEAVYSRMVPVLFAIKSHAEQIVLSTDISRLQTTMPRLFIDSQPDGATGLEYFSPALTSDFQHFLHKRNIEKDPVCKYRIRKCMRPLWVVGTKCKFAKELSNSQSIMLDEQAPPVFASSPKFSVSTSDDGLFEREGFWAMFRTFVDHGDEASVWGLWAQRLMMELKAEIGVVVLPCPYNASKTVAETVPSSKSRHAYKSVTSWSCPEDVEFFRCAISLAVQLHQDGHVTHKALEALHVWLAELWAVNYTPPQRQSFRFCLGPDVQEGCVIHNPARKLSGGNAGMPEYTKPQKLFPAIETKCLNQPKPPGISDPFMPYTLNMKDNSKVRDIALVLIFYSSSIYSNIIFLEELHRKYFNQIIYCGPNATHFTSFYTDFNRPISYIEVPGTNGFIAYDCLNRAMMMNYGVGGYLEMADDVILNTWTFGSIPRDRFWFQTELRTASRFERTIQEFAVTFPTSWWPWTINDNKWGFQAMANVWHRLQNIRTNGSHAQQKIANEFLEMLEHNSGNTNNFFYSSSDIFYVPAMFRRSWIFLGDIFVQNNVFLDVAVPTLMNGIDLTGNIIRMDGTYLWYNNRANYAVHYRGFLNFFHPWKMGWIHQPEHAHFICYRVLPFIVDDLVDETDKTKNTP